ncbi:hypothetical protein TNIN_40711 [Trichonephila inaurata madagascariensis]|uniref:Uncharacterized protein n=1 Tax=Trichonephila inaurata madagascariensis TaxID=2747483 RepID=A0A8X6M9Y6_9ARAC|nr:hypothetical protein TNIN_40711 [Trichonephila inaurata madagascariensis]
MREARHFTLNSRLPRNPTASHYLFFLFFPPPPPCRGGKSSKCATGISIVLRIKLETWDRLEEETMPAFMAVLRDASSGIVFVGFEIFISRAWNRQGQR